MTILVELIFLQQVSITKVHEKFESVNSHFFRFTKQIALKQRLDRYLGFTEKVKFSLFLNSNFFIKRMPFDIQMINIFF